MSASPAPSGTNTGPARPPSHPGIALAVLVTCQVMVALDGTVVNIALPSIRESLGFSPTDLAWVANAYILAFGGLLLLGGRAGDILGRRRLFIAGIGLFTVASLAGGLATTGGWLLAARVAQGVGAAFAAPGTLALVATNFEEGRPRNRALGAVTAGYGLSVVLGMVLGGVLTSWLGWRSVLFINVPVGIVLMALTPRFVNESPRNPGRFDLAGALTSTAGMAAVVYGFVNAASHGWSDGVTVVSVAAGVVLLAGFVTIERRATQPITPLHLFRSRNRSASYASMLLLAAPLVGMPFLTTQFLQNVLGFSPLEAGLGFLPMCAGLFAAAGAATQLLPRIGPKAVILIGILVIIAGMAWFTQLEATTSYVGGVLGPLIVLGVGPGLAFTALNQSILSGVPSQDSGAASGLLEVMQWGGGSLGLAIFVAVFGSASRDAARDSLPGASAELLEHHVLAEGMASAYVAGIAMGVVAFLIAVMMVRPPRPQETSEVVGEADTVAEAGTVASPAGASAPASGVPQDIRSHEQ